MTIADNLATIRARIGNTKLIAASKNNTADKILEAIKAGQKIFGENRVREAQSKFPDLRHSNPDLELHLIGPLQTNKAQAAVQLFDVIQTLDRSALAEALSKAIAKTNRAPRLYIEINIGNEPQKAGIEPEAAAAFLTLCRDTYGLQISGLMCIPPQDKDPKPYFQQMRKLADTLKLPHLSMGMSADFETSITCGATEIRIGTAIFGPREKS